MTIIEDTKYLHLSYIREHYLEHCQEAALKEQSYEEFLKDLLQGECFQRRQNGIMKRMRSAHFPYQMILNDFRRDHLKVEVRQIIKELETLEFIEEKKNIILIGNPGTGKTALSIALGSKAVEEGRSVLFISIPSLLIELKEAMSANQITAYKKKFESYDLVILDELGYCTFDVQAGEILFNLLSSRNEHKSMIITSNLVLDQWNEIFRDQLLTGAIIDRLTNLSYLVNMTGSSYRIQQTKEWIQKRKEAAVLN
ncbi:IS21-like element helper ATPase IstB [Ileibacterium valens]|nr:IS21-like element helper ATPase IstB [Ileibacterium valens]